MNAQPQAIENEASTYHTANRQNLEQAVKQSGNHIAEQYVANLDDGIRRLIEEVSKQKEFSELNEEQRNAALRPLIYVNLVNFLEDFEAKDEEVAKAQKEFFGLNKADDREMSDAVREYLRRDLGLSSNAANLAETGRVYRESIVPRKKSMLSRFIASKLITEEDGNYRIDVEKFKKIYGTSDNYRKLAYNFVETAKAAQRQAQAQSEAAA